MDTQSSLSPALARRIDRLYSAIRRNKRMAAIAIDCCPTTGKTRNRDRYYQLLSKMREQANTITDLILDVLTGMGYKAWTFSYSHYIMIDTEIHLDIHGVIFRVWSFNAPQYYIHIESDSYYNYPLLRHPRSSIDVYTYTLQKLVDYLHTLRGIIQGYQQCLTCHYSSPNEFYCGLGLTVMGHCSHHRTSIRG